ncbi:MAG: hypothetical protein KDK27_15000, partial [Leptospiraceae bacterium]|nr:hypothetical protein [Leptospiraceae bacterium]
MKQLQIKRKAGRTAAALRWLPVLPIVLPILTLLTGALPLQLKAAPVENLTPISLAKVYPNRAFEKPGDINKSYVSVFLIEQGSDTVGIRFTGHTEIEICRRISTIMVEMYAELRERGYDFGDDFYLGYGVFDGPVTPELSTLYNRYTRKILRINEETDGILSVRRISLENYQKLENELQAARDYARSNHTTLITTFHFPLNFQVFAHERKIADDPMNRLLSTIRSDTLEIESRMARMEQERHAVESAVQQLRELPTLEGIHYRYREGQSASTRNNREQIRKHMQTAEFQSKLEKARSTLQSIYDQFPENPATPAGKRMTAFSKAMLEEYTESTILQQLMNKSQNYYLTDFSVSWKDLGDTVAGKDFITYLQRFVSSLDNFIEFSRGLGEMHSLTLLDASMRGWPALDFSEYGDIYRQAVQLRIQQDVQGQYHFFRGNENDYHLYASLSGTVLHVTNGQTDRFVQIEDLIQDTAQIPDESQVRRQLLDSLPDDTRVAVATVDLRNPDHPYRSAPSTPDATIDLSSITNDFFKSDFDRTGMLTRLRGSAPMDRSAQHMFPLQSEVRNRRRVYTGDLFYIQPGQYQLRISPAGQLRADSTLRYLLNKMIAHPETQRLFAVGRAVDGTRTPAEIESIINKPSHFMRVMLPAILPVQLDANQSIDAEMLSLRRGDPLTQLSKE